MLAAVVLPAPSPVEPDFGLAAGPLLALVQDFHQNLRSHVTACSSEVAAEMMPVELAALVVASPCQQLACRPKRLFQTDFEGRTSSMESGFAMQQAPCSSGWVLFQELGAMGCDVMNL